MPVIASSVNTGMRGSPPGLRDGGEIERGITAFARGSNGGVIVTASPLATVHRQLIIALAARHNLPAVGGFHSTCLPALVTAMEAWYDPSIA
jgi:hypothetical protein